MPNPRRTSHARRTRPRSDRGEIVDVREQRYPAESEELANVRTFVREVINDRGVDVPFADFVVTEFSTNAIVHARSEFGVRVGFTASSLRIEVSDKSDAPPIVGRHQPAVHGLEMVDRLVYDWGYDPSDDGGKTVWAELPLRPN
jgi:hypothetical protein